MHNIAARTTDICLYTYSDIFNNVRLASNIERVRKSGHSSHHREYCVLPLPASIPFLTRKVTEILDGVGLWHGFGNELQGKETEYALVKTRGCT